MEEQIQQLESKLATMKKRITQLKQLDSVDHTAKINTQIYPSKTEAEIKAHLESVRELEIKATHTHALLSASFSKGLKSYVQEVTKRKPNPYVLWHALKDRFHNKSLNLQANLQRFNAAQKEQDEQMMDFIARLQQLLLQASTTASPIGDDTFIALLRAGLPSDFNATQSTSYLKSHGTVDTNTVDHICAILFDHE